MARCENCGYDPDDDLDAVDPIDPAVVEKFAKYLKLHPSWGAFHCCLHDGNWDSSTNAEYCLEIGDREAANLAPLLEAMSERQREALANQVDDVIKSRAKRPRKKAAK